MRLLLWLWLLVALPLHATNQPLRVFACEPEWAALVSELGGKYVNVFSATTAKQDPHHIEARPSLIARARQADLLVCTGADLEIGWLPLLLRQAANPAILEGQKAHFLAADYVLLKEAPSTIDRSQGDVHPEGNPHIQLDPKNILAIAQPLAQRLAELDAAHSSIYEQRYRQFAGHWQNAIQGWEKAIASLAGTAIVVQHHNWTYFLDWAKLKEIASLEPMPGIPPSIGYLQKVLQLLQDNPARFIIRAAHENPKPASWLGDRTKIPVVVLSPSPNWQEGESLFKWFDGIVQALPR